ncbi:PPE family protein [Mycobacterium camsae]|uniref:PPE family protein n=1 Tax=Mycobacterium gordonae TaxID=1778 RepID=UPI00197CF8B1|nr:PPE family protein [Mycobacterium gordonae]
MDLGALPPEITSAMMYSGPGATSFVAAAAAWSTLADELTSTARSYDLVLTQLVGEEWLGLSSAAMAATVQPYVAWMTATAALAEHAGTQARSAAAAFETAFAAIVPPPLVGANRVALAQALASNVLGLNSGVIAQLETQYAEMWAQNAAAMYRYAAASAAASTFEPFAAAPSVTNPAGATSQAAAVTSAQVNPAASIQDSLARFFDQITSQLRLLAAPGGTQRLIEQWEAGLPLLSQSWFLLTGQTTLPSNLGTFMQGYGSYASVFYTTEGLPYFSVGMSNFAVQIAKSAGWLNTPASTAAHALPAAPAAGALGAAGGQLAAGMGEGAHIGNLAVPSSWPGASTAAMTVRPAVEMISEPYSAGEPAVNESLLSGLPVTAGGTSRGAGSVPRYGIKPTVMPRRLPVG